MAEQQALIVPYRDGPYLVRGPVSLCDQDGAEIETGRAIIALCRCGRSRMRPFCDGSHHVVRFRAGSGREARGAESGTGSAAPPGADHDVSELERDVRLYRARLQSASLDDLAPEVRARLADAARLMAEAAALMHGGPVDTSTRKPV